MLLIAQPKSASTSLLYTLKQITKKEIKEGIPRKPNEKDCPGFPEIQKHHCNMIQRNELFLKQVTKGRKTIFREHLMPTNDHLNILKKLNTNIVILLRDTNDSCDSYMRFNKKTDKEQIKKDLDDFHKKYVDFSRKNSRIVLIVYYKDLILNYIPTMKNILRHFNLKIPKKIPLLQKRKFTGVGLKRLRGSK
jgi:hypothetical protein